MFNDPLAWICALGMTIALALQISTLDISTAPATPVAVLAANP